MLSMLYRLTVGVLLLKSGTMNGPILGARTASCSRLLISSKIPMDTLYLRPCDLRTDFCLIVGSWERRTTTSHRGVSP